MVTIIFGSFFYMLDSINKGNISTLVAKNLLRKKKPFSLYLRAFKSDRDATNFSEDAFVGLIYKKGEPELYAIGEPEEVDAPEGAKRLYLSQSSWEADVYQLMQRAQSVYLRICNTEPCKWELDKALRLKKKPYLIVDNIEDYSSIREQHQSLPVLPELEGVLYFLYNESNNEWKIKKYKLAPTGYIDVTDSEDEYLEAVEAVRKDLAEKFKEKETQKINTEPLFLGGIAIAVLFVGINLLINNANPPRGKYNLLFAYETPFGRDINNKGFFIENFDANDDSMAYEYANEVFTNTVEGIICQYNGNLHHDDSLDYVCPLDFRVARNDGEWILTYKTTSQSLWGNKQCVFCTDEYYGAKWGMTIDEVMDLSRYADFKRKDFVYHKVTSVQDTLLPLVLLRGKDIVMGYPVDEWLIFGSRYQRYGLIGMATVSSNLNNNPEKAMQMLSDFAFHFRKEYGPRKQGRWDMEKQTASCDTLRNERYYGVVTETQLKQRRNTVCPGIAEAIVKEYYKR